MCVISWREREPSILNLMITRFVYFPIVAAAVFSQIGNGEEKSQKKSRSFVQEAKPNREEKIFHYLPGVRETMNDQGEKKKAGRRKTTRKEQRKLLLEIVVVVKKGGK